MNENKKPNLYFEYFYMLAITATICLLPLLYYKMSVSAMLIVFIIVLTVIITIWRKPMSRKLLYLLDILNVIAAISFSFLIMLILGDAKASIVSFIIAIVILDVYSFTRRGKHTLNAKLIANTSTLARLSICLPVPGKPGLQPLIGIGDLYFYTVMCLFALDLYGTSHYYIVILILVIGQLANIILISLTFRKKWYKGFPATLFPGLFYLVSLVLGVIK